MEDTGYAERALRAEAWVRGDEPFYQAQRCFSRFPTERGDLSHLWKE